MNQTQELARVKARIKALTEKTVANGCTEAEAMSAAEMVGRLLERYALSMDEIEVREARCVQAEVPMGGQRRRPIDACVPAIARFCDCKVWLARATSRDLCTRGCRGDVWQLLCVFRLRDRYRTRHLSIRSDRTSGQHRDRDLPRAKSALVGRASAAGLGELLAWCGGPGVRPPGRDAPRP